MKYVITWTQRSGGSAAENEASAARLLDLVGKWAPGPDETVHQWVLRIDGQGGFAVVEGDNPADFLRNTAVWSPFSDFTVYPVVDFAEGMQVIREATEWRKSST